MTFKEMQRKINNVICINNAEALRERSRIEIQNIKELKVVDSADLYKVLVSRKVWR
jgi:hypothetical protein